MKKLVVNKEDLKNNIEKVQALAGDKTKVIAVVKGNGYGLGLVEYSKYLVSNGIDFLAVGTLEEGVSLRKAEIKEDILMLSGTYVEDDLKMMIENDLIITLSSTEACRAVAKLSIQLGKEVRVHVKIDTGFGRYGFLYDDIETIIKVVNGEYFGNKSNVKIEGIYSHYSLAYYKKSESAEEQSLRFKDVLRGLSKANVEYGIAHICNSPGFLNFPDMKLNAVRVGSAFVGRVDCPNTIGLKRIGELKTNVVEMKIVPKGFNIGYLDTYKTKRDTELAIVPLGYLEGFNLGNKQDMFRFVDNLRAIVQGIKKILKKQKLQVSINNKNYDVIGKVGMYHLTIDVTGGDVELGDEVILQVNPLLVDKDIVREYI